MKYKETNFSIDDLTETRVKFPWHLTNAVNKTMLHLKIIFFKGNGCIFIHKTRFLHLSNGDLV